MEFINEWLKAMYVKYGWLVIAAAFVAGAVIF